MLKVTRTTKIVDILHNQKLLLLLMPVDTEGNLFLVTKEADNHGPVLICIAGSIIDGDFGINQ